mmetsp:Transcript_68829/g.61816  ORF Transcript_68829/g.61816 Transcript_68829/m.61816 type:complete len:199 (+) Transcript_68829:66-662(+)
MASLITFTIILLPLLVKASDYRCDDGILVDNDYCFPAGCSQTGGSGCGSAGQYCCYSNFDEGNIGDRSCDVNDAPCRISDNEGGSDGTCWKKSSFCPENNPNHKCNSNHMGDYTDLLQKIGDYQCSCDFCDAHSWNVCGYGPADCESKWTNCGKGCGSLSGKGWVTAHKKPSACVFTHKKVCVRACKSWKGCSSASSS